MLLATVLAVLFTNPLLAAPSPGPKKAIKSKPKAPKKRATWYNNVVYLEYRLGKVWRNCNTILLSESACTNLGAFNDA